jgi:hypothetical protein
VVSLGGQHARRRRTRTRTRVVVTRAAEEESVGERVMNAAGSAEEEAAGLAATRAILDASDGCPSADDETMLWFLRDRKMDPAATATKLEKFLRWRADLGSISDGDIATSVEAVGLYRLNAVDL